MLETLADFDDDLMTLLLEDQEPPTDLIMRDLRKTLRADQVVPVFMGVAEQDMGVRRLLEALAREVPEPDARSAAARPGRRRATRSSRCSRIYYLPHAGKLSLVRVWRGTVKDGTMLGDMRVGGVYRLFGGQQQNVGSAEAGEIVALGRLDGARTGAVLSAGSAVTLPQPPTVKPMYAFAVTAANRNDEVKLSGAFAKLTDEDPALRVETDAETHQTLLWGQGEIHLRVALDRLKNKYNVEVAPHLPRTPYRETIRKGAQAHGRHKKQSGGHGQFGDVKIEIRPLARGEGFQFENKVVGGAVPRQFIPAVEAGAREHLQRGPLGFPVVDVAVSLHDGQFHSVDSNELSFKLATAHALKEGLPQCDPVLLEPILSVTISVPSDYTAKALQLVSGKRGQILGYEAKRDWNGWDEINAQIPQGEMHDLIVTLRSLSQGTGFFEWRYDHLQEVPDRLGAGDRRQAPRSRGIAAGTARAGHRPSRRGPAAHQRPTGAFALRGLGRWIRRPAVLRAAIAVALLPTLLILIYRFVPPPGTHLMLVRLVQGEGLTKDWRPLERISPLLAAGRDRVRGQSVLRAFRLRLEGDGRSDRPGHGRRAHPRCQHDHHAGGEEHAALARARSPAQAARGAI